MPPRPFLPLRPIATLRPPWTCHACLQRTTRASPRRTQTSLFHATATSLSDSSPTHYETLQLTSTASAADVKRQFYTLSKKHHPDRNPDDPTASTRFVAISEAYHVLSVPEKRAQYDAQIQHSQSQSRWGRSGGNHPQGSYSSASFGSRPASGLNKKRSTFRGPPPSFFKAGGYGRHGAKRAEHAYQGAQTEGQEGSKEAGQESYGDFGGFGPGQQSQGHQVPHFDDRRHKEMHENVYNHINARRQRAQRMARVEVEYDRAGMVTNFILVASIIGLIGVIVKTFGDQHDDRYDDKNTGKRKEET